MERGNVWRSWLPGEFLLCVRPEFSSQVSKLDEGLKQRIGEGPLVNPDFVT